MGTKTITLQFGKVLIVHTVNRWVNGFCVILFVLYRESLSSLIRIDRLHGNPLFLHHRASDGNLLSVETTDEPKEKSGREYLSMYSNLACRAVVTLCIHLEYDVILRTSVLHSLQWLSLYTCVDTI